MIAALGWFAFGCVVGGLVGLVGGWCLASLACRRIVAAARAIIKHDLAHAREREQERQAIQDVLATATQRRTDA